MRIFFTALLLFSISTHGGWADCTKADGTAGCDAGKYCDSSNEANPTCTSCPDKFYCPGGTGAPKNDCGSNYEHSASPRTEQKNCYKNCPTLNNDTDPKFENGTWRPKESTIYYPTTNCSYPQENIKCNNDTDKCNGYHVESNKCISNIQTCAGSKRAAITNVLFNYNGKKVYDPVTKNYSECYITECPSDRHQENLGNICGFTYANDCAASRGNCSQKLGNCSGNITGEYSWVNEYKYDDCRCESTKSVTGEGEYINSCKLTNGKTGNNSSWGNCEYSRIISCAAGKCQSPHNKTPIKCSPSPRGYYSEKGKIDCDKCPAGATTSDAGKTKIDDCYISSVTQFRDNYGATFKLPIIDNIPYQPQLK